MIVKMNTIDYDKILKFIRRDSARNYFIRLGLESQESVFESAYAQMDGDGNMRAVLLKRRSGNLQFFSDGACEVEGFAEIIRSIGFNKMIGPASSCDRFIDKALFGDITDGAIIAELKDFKRQYEMMSYHEVESLGTNDLESVAELYKKVFVSFSPTPVMHDKLETDRGRGVCIKEDGRVVAVAQSDFEDTRSAVIVGVATDPQYQNRGLASKCLEVLCKELLSEGKALYLQYDNEVAGRIYGKLGFLPIDRVRHYSSKDLKGDNS